MEAIPEGVENDYTWGVENETVRGTARFNII